MGIGVDLVWEVIRAVVGGPHQRRHDYRNFHVWVSLEAERQDGDADEEHGYHAYHLQQKRRFYLLKDSDSSNYPYKSRSGYVKSGRVWYNIVLSSVGL